ncbi:MAG: ATP-binding protein [Acidimicrobiaceae bacterium]|nr:ATP-binding protein [Acidimicrobiaceae bacterium]
MCNGPADGERGAVRGYDWQYGHAAALVYDALLARDLVQVRLVDSTAGEVDDLVLVRASRVDAYQFRSAEYPGSVTFRQFIKPQRTRGGGHRRSIAGALADGWQRLQERWSDVHVHFVTADTASTRDCLTDGSQDGLLHFAAFRNQVLEPLRTGDLDIVDVAEKWCPALERLREATGLSAEDFAQFLASLHVDVATGSARPAGYSQRRSDLDLLTSALQQRVAAAAGVVELDTDGVLALVGWSERTRLHSRHDFPVDLDTYAPLSRAVDALKEMLSNRDNGYVAVVGPPGTGKSTLLSQALTGSTDRIIRYYAYVPHTAPLRTALTANAFLHDVVLMLDRSDLNAKDHLLASNDTNALRQSLTDYIDAAGSEFSQTGRRTIIVVDGLDHVDRDLANNPGLLLELPRPEELPAGVLFIVGSRTLDPLDSHTRVQIEESDTVIDLRDHPLPRASILQICERSPATARLPRAVHECVAHRSDGHPLTLCYLLNLLSAADAESAERVLATAPPYEGDLAANYRAVWDGLHNDDEVIEILPVCSRLRVGFKTEWLQTWTTQRAVRVFREKVLYLFHAHVGGLRFFHDSFRQFVADRTALGDSGDLDGAEDAAAHERVAELCARSDDSAIAAEELYHRVRAGQAGKALDLAEPVTFREQHRSLRSPDLIRSDIGAMLEAAADCTDVAAMLKLILALVETNDRTESLDEVDLPGLLYDVGLVEQAVAYCGDARRVPLIHAYELAARLAESGEPAGQRIFDLIDPEGLNQAHAAHTPHHGDDVAVAWARAAMYCRPLEAVMVAAQGLVGRPGTGKVDDEFGDEFGYRRWLRYKKVMDALIDTAAHGCDEQAIDLIYTRVTEQVVGIIEEDDSESINQDTRIRIAAALADLQTRAVSALVELAESTEAKQSRLGMLPVRGGTPLFPATMLDLAEALASNGRTQRAAELLEASRYGTPLTVSRLGYSGEPEAIHHDFRYWRLRHLLASDGTAPDLVPSDEGARERDDITSDAAAHSDATAAEFASRLDSAVRTLARIDAATESGRPMSVPDVWSELVGMIHSLGRPSEGVTTALIGILQRRPAVIEILVDVAVRYGEDIPQRLGDLLGSLFRQDPPRWPLPMQLEVANNLAAAGVRVPWHRETLAALEAYAASEDVSERLRSTADIARGYMHAGHVRRAQEVALGLIPMAFGVGYRKDYQLQYWVAWLGRAIAEPDGKRFFDDAVWLARLLKAAAPMSESRTPAGAADLPAAIVPADPVLAVRVFEYLVRHGAVAHTRALAELLRALVTDNTRSEIATIKLGADIAAEIVAPAANSAYPRLAESLVAAAERVAGRSGARHLAESVASRTDKYALPTARAGWRHGLGLAAPDVENTGSAETAASHSRTWYSRDPDDDHLVLSDGQRLPRGEVAARIRSARAIASLRNQQSSESSFRWAEIVARLTLTGDDSRILARVFNSQSPEDVEVLVSLAESAESNGDPDTALQIALDIMEQAPRDAWSYGHPAPRRRAAAITVRLGGPTEHVSACRDLALCAMSEDWVPSQLLRELHSILEALAPGLGAASTWPAIRSYLEGMAETLDLGSSDDVKDHGCRWWLAETSANPRAASADSTSHGALAELAVGHISHPTWLVSDAAISIVSSALTAGDTEVAEALARFAQAATADDTLESAGRCLAAARSASGYVVPTSLQPLDRTLAEHPSQVLRDLATNRSPRAYRPLRQAYRLALPSPGPLIGSELPLLEPHLRQYELIAEHVGLDLDTVLSVATRYVSQAIDRLPAQTAVLAALRSAGMRHTYKTVDITASREAFGRILADLIDADLLKNVPPQTLRILRTIDVDALNWTPAKRPAVVPGPPRAGYDRTIEDWQAETESRIDEYAYATRVAGRTLIAATSRLTVLNQYHLQEFVMCATTVGAAPSDAQVASQIFATLQDLIPLTSGRMPGSGGPLVVQDRWYLFHQWRAGWLVFRPDLAAALAWVPDPPEPGRWHTADGDLAVETIWWVDGWWGRADVMADDTAAEGHAVVLTTAGLADVSAAFGETTTRFELTRDAQFDQEAAPVTATRLQYVTGTA